MFEGRNLHRVAGSGGSRARQCKRRWRKGERTCLVDAVTRRPGQTTCFQETSHLWLLTKRSLLCRATSPYALSKRARGRTGERWTAAPVGGALTSAAQHSPTSPQHRMTPGSVFAPSSAAGSATSAFPDSPRSAAFTTRCYDGARLRYLWPRLPRGSPLFQVSRLDEEQLGNAGKLRAPWRWFGTPGSGISRFARTSKNCEPLGTTRGLPHLVV